MDSQSSPNSSQVLPFAAVYFSVSTERRNVFKGGVVSAFFLWTFGSILEILIKVYHFDF